MPLPTVAKTDVPTDGAIVNAAIDKSNWEYITVPDEDIFGDKHSGFSINFEHFGPGTHYVDPEKAKTLKVLLANRMRSDIRILQPNQDKKMLEVMERNGVRR
jgi:hypothetical protein